MIKSLKRKSRLKRANNLKDNFMNDLEKIFPFKRDYIIHQAKNFKIRIEFAPDWHDKPVMITLYKKDNFLIIDKVKSSRFEFTQIKEVLETILSFKNEIELKEIFRK